MSTYSIFRTRQNTRLDIVNTQQEKSQSLYLVYTSQFFEFRKAIEVARETFSQEQIWPDQCDYVIYKIKPLQKTATSIANSAKKKGSKSSGYNCYPLLVSAHYICDQVDLLIEFIREYKEIIDQRSAKKSKHRLVVNSLHNLDSSLYDLMNELDKVMQNSQPV